MKTVRFKFVAEDTNIEFPVKFCTGDDKSILAVDINSVETADKITIDYRDPAKVTLFRNDKNLIVRPNVVSIDGTDRNIFGFDNVNDKINSTDLVFYMG